MDAIKSMRAFVRALELKGLSAAAREQRITQPTMSKLVAGLEKSLGVRLLERSSTRVAPTEEGKRFYERAKRLLEQYDDAVADARGLTQEPAGLLRVNAPLAFGELHLNALVLEFLTLYPRIQVELTLGDRFIDLREEGVDLALRLGGPLPPQSIARRLGMASRVLVCAPAYLHGRAPIRKPQDLQQHDAVRFAWADPIDSVELSGPDGTAVVPVHGRYRINSSIAVRESLLAGAGFELAPSWLVQDLLQTGQLVRILPRWQGPSQQAHLLHASRRHQPQRVRAFADFLAERVLQLPGFRV
jgi:DNA-binding transcriptional LysR family regulator